LNWKDTKLNGRAAVWTVLILIGFHIAFQIREGGLSHVTALLWVEVLILVVVLTRKPKNSN